MLLNLLNCILSPVENDSFSVVPESLRLDNDKTCKPQEKKLLS